MTPAPGRIGRAVAGPALVALVIAVDLVVWGAQGALRFGAAAPVWAVPVATSAVYLTLLVRRTRPVPVFAAHWVYGLVGVLVPGYEPFAGILVALYTVAANSRMPVAAAALASMAVPFGINTYNATATAGDSSRTASLLASVALWTVLAYGVWAAGRARFRARMRSAEAQSRLRQQSAVALREERLRLARELHDIVAHSVSVMILQAAGTRMSVSDADDRVTRSLETIESTGVQAMNELHRLLGLLRTVDRDAADSTPGTQPGLADLPALARGFESTTLEVCLASSGRPRALDPSGELAAFRVAQEGLTNVVKHAPGAGRARVELAWSDAGLTITVTDDGPADDGGGDDGRGDDERSAGTTSGGFGLVGLRERLALVGGELSAGRGRGGTGQGFVLRATLPAASIILPAAPAATPAGPYP